MKKMSNMTKDKIKVTAILVFFAAVMITLILFVAKAFGENIVEMYETDVYTYTTVEHEKCFEIRTYDKQAGKYLESRYVGKNYGEE